jgi:hypothetical protein
MLHRLVDSAHILAPGLRVAVVLGLLAACDGTGGQPTGHDTSALCCECACSRNGIPCLSVTIEGDESASCPELCETECSAHDDCPSVERIELCNAAPDDRGDQPGPRPGPGPCSQVLEDDIDDCPPPSPN